MKKGVLNYSITWQEDGEKREELYCSKLYTIAAYIDMLRAANRNISELRIWEIYKSIAKPAEDITSRVNRFLA